MRAQDMTQGKPTRLILTFALPLMAGSICQQLYTLTDTAIVGNFVGVGALASLGATDWFNYMVLSVVFGFMQGFSILLSQRFGAGDLHGLRRAFAMSVVMAGMIAVVMTALSEGLAAWVLTILQTPANIFDGALTYITIYYMGIPLLTAYNLLAGALRALGDSRMPLVAMVISSVMNIALDMLCVVVLGWGIAGAAAATVAAQGASALYCFLAIRKAPQLRLTRADWHMDRALCGKLIRLGLPVALQNGIISGGGMVVQRVVNGFGFLFIAGYTATNKLYGLLELAAISFGHALSVYTGQNAGAQRLDRIKAGARAGTWISLATSAVICGLMLIFGRSILSLFISASPAEYDVVMGYAYEFLCLMSVCLPILYMLYVYRSVLQGMGDTITPMVSGIVELVMRIGTAILLSGIIGGRGAFVAEVTAWFGAAVLQGVCYYRRIRKPG